MVKLKLQCFKITYKNLTSLKSRVPEEKIDRKIRLRKVIRYD